MSISHEILDCETTRARPSDQVRANEPLEFSKEDQPIIWALAALPPPVNGMTLFTQKILERIQQKYPVTTFNFSSGHEGRRFYFRISRSLRTARGLARLALNGRVRNARLMITANSQGGLILTGLLVKAGRKLGYSVCLHHHTYRYIDKYDARMAWIDRMMSDRDIHLVHCQKMADEFQAKYKTKARFKFLYPSVVSLPLGKPRDLAQRPFRVGHLGNLSLEKGLDLVLQTFGELRRQGRDVRLSLAGHCCTREAQRMVQRALAEHNHFVEYHGGVYGERKAEFFNSIDCFLLPTRTESWGIVLNEALATGVPVIATDRGCVSTLMGHGTGTIVREESNYVADAVRQIETWIDLPETYRDASHAAIQQADRLHHQAAEQLEQLVAHIGSPVYS